MTYEQGIVSETAFQRIERLQDRPSLYGLDPNLFHRGPEIKEVIEVSGESGAGTIILISELIRKCILPKHYCDIKLHGLEAGVVFFNSDFLFNKSIFDASVIQHLNNSIPQSLANKEETVKLLCESSLQRLIIWNIYNSEYIYGAFHNLKNVLFARKDVSLIIIDSICANYWQDRLSDRIMKMDAYIIHILSKLHKCIEPFKVTVIFTRPSYFQTRSTAVTDVSPIYNLLNINTSIKLTRLHHEEEPTCLANVRTSERCYIKFYSFGINGIVWSPD